MLGYRQQRGSSKEISDSMFGINSLSSRSRDLQTPDQGQNERRLRLISSHLLEKKA
jgi:hypothetical protein